ncbi:hypothetical protein [Flavobacterium undicola]|uniref:hypothetical protein n=1 Tax=Flavobacterium undicola TaxID=1932779 RepID=UPI001378462F|nr:hypothetical protein [Flavobacterium undicola]MBA0882681.1 hypothetical protein [Flavobacterium undicola]
MKKRLEADLISIAHRILQLKDKSDINQLYLETQKLYEKLSVLKFIEENYADAKPTIGNYSEIEKEIENIYDKEASLPIETEITESNLAQETEIVETKEETPEIVVPETEAAIIDVENPDDEIPSEEIISVEEAEMENNDAEFQEQEPEIEIEEEEIEEKTEEEIADEVEETKEFIPAFELSEKVETEIEEAKKTEAVQISFEDLLGLNYNEPEFIKVDKDAVVPAKNIVFEAVEEETETETPLQKEIETTEKTPSKTVSLNDKLAKKGIEIDLNDRIAFVKHLFGNSNEDYNRVMNQLITYDNFFETKSFIDEMVKPDYNNWEGKEEYEERFMEIIEKKFL